MGTEWFTDSACSIAWPASHISINRGAVSSDTIGHAVELKLDTAMDTTELYF